VPSNRVNGRSVTLEVRNIYAYILFKSSIYTTLLLYLFREVELSGKNVRDS